MQKSTHSLTFAAMLLLSACTLKKDEPLIIIDPVFAADRLDYEVTWDAGDPDLKDTTFYVYDEIGRLVRITDKGGDALKDTSAYQYSFEYGNDGFVKRKVKYPANTLYSVDTFSKTGNNLITIKSTRPADANSTVYPMYLNGAGRVTHAGDTTFAANIPFDAFTWTGPNITEQTRYEWNGPAYQAKDKTVYTYDLSRKNPYATGSIQWHRATAWHYARYIDAFSTHLVTRKEYSNPALNEQTVWDLQWTFNKEDLPELCTVTGVSTGNAGSHTIKRYIKYHYSKR